MNRCKNSFFDIRTKNSEVFKDELSGFASLPVTQNYNLAGPAQTRCKVSENNIIVPG